MSEIDFTQITLVACLLVAGPLFIFYQDYISIFHSNENEVQSAEAFPDPEPILLLTSASSSTEIYLSWLPSEDVTGYRIERESPIDNGFSVIIPDTGNLLTEYNDTALAIGTEYNYRVSAINQFGISIADDSSSARTWGYPDPPTNLGATAIAMTQIKLSWSAPAFDGDRPITGYKIERQDACAGNYNTVTSDTGNTTTVYTDTGLTSTVCYNYKTSAINTVGTGNGSNIATATTPSSPPNPASSPTNLLANTISSGQIDLSWTAPAGPVTGYKIERESPTGQGFGTIQADTGSSSTTYSVSGLATLTQYNFRVSAINATGVSSSSNEKSNYTASDQPTSLIAIAKSQSKIDISWAATGTGATTVMSDINTNTGENLISTRPIHAEFASSSSSLVDKQIDTIKLRIKKSGSPTGTAQIGVFNTDLSVKKLFDTKDVSTLTTSYADYTFSLPAGDQPYLIQVNDRIGIKFTGGDGSNEVSIMRDTSPSSFDGTNSYHTFYSSGWQNFTTDDLTMTLSLLNVTGATSFKIERESPVGGGFSTLVADTGNAITVYNDTGLATATQYNYRVSGIAHEVLSTASNAAATTTWTVPSAPINLGATAISTTQINLSWQQPSNNGGTAITGYKIQRQDACTGSFSTIVNDTASTATTYDNTGLVANTCYIYKIFAYNLVGISAVSNNATATTPSSPPTLPSPPTSLIATATSNSTIDLSWTAPSGSVTGYKVERATGSSGFGTIQANTGNTSTTYSDAGLTNATTYNYRVSTINASGTGSPSNTASATTTGTSVTLRVDSFGVQQFYAQKTGKQSFVVGTNNPNTMTGVDLKNIVGSATAQVQSSFNYWTLQADSGRSVRVNLNPSLSSGTQSTWQVAEPRGYMVVPQDIDEFEQTGYFRVRSTSADDDISYKQGGQHTSCCPSLAGSFGILLSYSGTKSKTTEKELNHPDYEFFSDTKLVSSGSLVNKWVGVKEVSRHVPTGQFYEVFIDLNPIDFTTGNPNNNWKKFYSHLDDGSESGQYGGHKTTYGKKYFTYRMDDAGYIDFALLSVYHIDNNTGQNIP